MEVEDLPGIYISASSIRSRGGNLIPESGRGDPRDRLVISSMAEARPVRQKPSDTNGQHRGTRSACDRGGTCESKTEI
ncbi:hypothetical protein BgiBS90_017030 [Biomphalaria glabrata]|nr:hypothetical protein BgiBS90_017030 [Biomphalaria glabrata]